MLYPYLVKMSKAIKELHEVEEDDFLF
jgi:hypothetical protein